MREVGPDKITYSSARLGLPVETWQCLIGSFRAFAMAGFGVAGIAQFSYYFEHPFIIWDLHRLAGIKRAGADWENGPSEAYAAEAAVSPPP